MRETKPSDVKPVATRLYFLPVRLERPLRFGTETVDSFYCARVEMTVVTREGKYVTGWGETPLNVQWAWQSSRDPKHREAVMIECCRELARAWAEFDRYGHPLEVGAAFLEEVLPTVQRGVQRLAGTEPFPTLTALVCCSPFDIALYDAFGKACGRPALATLTPQYMNSDLSAFLDPAAGSLVSFNQVYPADYLRLPPAEKMPVWHLVGALDSLEPEEATSAEGMPSSLRAWIREGGLRCIKIKLCGTDATWDYERLVQVGALAMQEGVNWLGVDFNGTARTTEYVNSLLDRLMWEYPRIYGMLLYVEQPFAPDLESRALDVHSVAARKTLVLDESAHDWRAVLLGRELGWNGVAIKIAKTLTNAVLTTSWAAAHGMRVLVQDLTNPMLALVAHLHVAAYLPTFMGVESNSIQYCPSASRIEAQRFPGLFQRHQGEVVCTTARQPGLGYGGVESERPLPECDTEAGNM